MKGKLTKGDYSLTGLLEVQDASIPKEGAQCYIAGRDSPNKSIKFVEAIKNHFTPEVYQYVTSSISSFKLLESYYLNTNGEKATYETDPRITSVLARIKKILSLEQVAGYWKLKEVLLSLGFKADDQVLMPLIGFRLLD